ncbi:hypothetical protein B0H17DRAFT_1124038 [Mycena rosella]|uniref:Uncharacterized protein n=1 Tax=Mycena rosella TaxID=1033263 RepID=A0AAD7H3I6_MYCRO|nr:hypothetical protein B0H17DRAFT_1124038 [Mycena rosella]
MEGQERDVPIMLCLPYPAKSIFVAQFPTEFAPESGHDVMDWTLVGEDGDEWFSSQDSERRGIMRAENDRGKALVDRRHTSEIPGTQEKEATNREQSVASDKISTKLLREQRASDSKNYMHEQHRHRLWAAGATSKEALGRKSMGIDTKRGENSSGSVVADNGIPWCGRSRIDDASKLRANGRARRWRMREFRRSAHQYYQDAKGGRELINTSG